MVQPFDKLMVLSELETQAHHKQVNPMVKLKSKIPPRRGLTLQEARNFFMLTGKGGKIN